MDEVETPETTFERVCELIDSYGGSGRAAIDRSRANGITARDLVEQIARANEHSKRELRAFDPWSVAPGLVEPRVLDQPVWWVDVAAKPHLIRELSDAHLLAVISFLGERVRPIRSAYENALNRHGEELPDSNWLADTTLMRTLCAEGANRASIAMDSLPLTCRPPR